jgi:cyanophycin synthetase
VVKPDDRGAGRGVSADIRDAATLERSIEIARAASSKILIEAHEPGDDFRLTVVDGRLAMAVRLDPPQIIGDGMRTVSELIAGLNEERRSSDTYLQQVPEDEVLQTTLAAQGVTETTVPPKGATIRLRTNANHATGGVVTNVIEEVHPQVRRLVEQLTAAMGFRLAGIDYITTDIRKSHDEVGGGIIEVNTTAGVEVVINAGIVPEALAEAVIGTVAGRIPVLLLIAPADAHPAIREALGDLLAHGWAASGTDWARLGRLELPVGDLDGFARAQALLLYPGVERLLVLWSGEDLYRFGLPGDTLAQAILVGIEPVDEWLALLKRRSARLDKAGSTDEAVAMILEGAK